MMSSLTFLACGSTDDWLHELVLPAIGPYRPYVKSSCAAYFSIVPIFHDLVEKRMLQLQSPVASMPKTWREDITTSLKKLKHSAKAGFLPGIILGGQMALQKEYERGLLKCHQPNAQAILTSSACVGVVTSPLVALIDMEGARWFLVPPCGGKFFPIVRRNSIFVDFMHRKQEFSAKRVGVVSFRETALLAGLGSADSLSDEMKKKFGNYKAVEYLAAFVAGVTGSLIGHPADTAWTRWRNGFKIENSSQLMLGASRRACGIGFFSMFYKFCKDSLG